jgi:hypothetical protein
VSELTQYLVGICDRHDEGRIWVVLLHELPSGVRTLRHVRVEFNTTVSNRKLLRACTRTRRADFDALMDDPRDSDDLPDVSGYRVHAHYGGCLGLRGPVRSLYYNAQVQGVAWVRGVAHGVSNRLDRGLATRDPPAIAIL